MYLKRTIEKQLISLKNQFAAITIYGARQVGKSTMVKKLFGKEMDFLLKNSNEIMADIDNLRNLLELKFEYKSNN